MRSSCDDGLMLSSKPGVGAGLGSPAPVIAKERIIRLKTVLDRTGLSRSALYRKMAEGTFPRQISISTRSTGWRESAINQWIDDPGGWLEEGSIEAET